MKHKIPVLDLSYLSKNKDYDAQNRDFQLITINDFHLAEFAKRLNCYQVIICVKGFAKVRVQGDEYEYVANSIATFSPITIFEILEVSPDYEAISIVFTNSFIVETLNNSYFLERFTLFNSDQCIYKLLTQEEASKVFAIFLNIQSKILDKKHPYRRGIVRSSIIILLYELEGLMDKTQTISSSSLNIGGDEVLSKFQELLKLHFKEERQVGFYAKMLNTPAIKLNKILSIVVGKTAKNMIDEVRLTEAKILLKSGKYNVSEVSNALYYLNVEEFSRFIKRKTGKTPSDYLHEAGR